ncbi:MAG: glycosyltransferase family 4 protein [Bacteroidetes bacterium]|nr:glycosyltransferase family 4 protein [Bacteroidota bacterium]
MQIIHIIPGSGGSFYCGNCLRDSKYVDALRAKGMEVIKIPMYLPLFADENNLNDIPVFYGAISIYLKQLWPIFRHAPRWFDRLLNSKPALKLASGMAGSTRAKGLEEMTVSMLLGEDGGQEKELDTMVNWIGEHFKPDVVHLSNALLLGLAHRIKEKLKVPVVCTLQDEDVWVDVMKPSFQQKVWELMQEKAAHVDAFIAVSDFFALKMKERMHIPEEKLHRLHLGVDTEDYNFLLAGQKSGNIGYISRMCPENGFDILIDAFIEFQNNPNSKNVQLIVTGGSTGDDSDFIKKQKKKLEKAGIPHKIEFHENFEEEGRNQFFEKVSIVSVPVPNGEAFGLYLLEALASGVPVVQPEIGSFPEIIAASKGGVIYKPHDAKSLAKAWEQLLFDKEKLNATSKAGKEGILEHFNIYTQATKMLDIYKSLE